MINPRRSIKTLLGIALLALPLACSAEGVPSRYVAGEHYTQLENRLPTESGGKIEVIEFFLYGCSHCNAFDPLVSEWAENAPDDVAFRRVPVTFSGLGPLFARTFYTAKELGALDELHTKLFAAIHEEKRDLTTQAKIRAWFVENGVEGEQFDEAFNSPQVKQQAGHASELMRAYRVDGVPSMAVAGEYKINGRQAGGNAEMLMVTDFLISKARSN